MATATIAPDIFEDALVQDRIRVDRDKGMIYGVKLFQRRSRNRRYLTDRAMNDLVEQSDRSMLAKAHRKRPLSGPPEWCDAVAKVQNPRREGEFGYGDLAVRTKLPLGQQLLDDAETDPTGVSISMEIQSGNYEFEIDRDAKEVAITGVKKLDQYALTTEGGMNNGLFEQFEPEFSEVEMPDKATTVAALKEQYPELMDTFQKDIVEQCACENSDKATIATLQRERDDLRKQIETLQGELDGFKIAEKKAETSKAIVEEWEKLAGENADPLSDDLLETLCELPPERSASMLKEFAERTTVAKPAGTPPVTPASSSGMSKSPDVGSGLRSRLASLHR